MGGGAVSGNNLRKLRRRARRNVAPDRAPGGLLRRQAGAVAPGAGPDEGSAASLLRAVGIACAVFAMICLAEVRRLPAWAPEPTPAPTATNSPTSTPGPTPTCNPETNPDCDDEPCDPETDPDCEDTTPTMTGTSPPTGTPSPTPEGTPSPTPECDPATDPDCEDTTPTMTATSPPTGTPSPTPDGTPTGTPTETPTPTPDCSDPANYGFGDCPDGGGTPDPTDVPIPTGPPVPTPPPTGTPDPPGTPTATPTPTPTPCFHPVNFRVNDENPPKPYFNDDGFRIKDEYLLSVAYKWDSSSGVEADDDGHLNDLSGCYIGEWVTYDGYEPSGPDEDGRCGKIMLDCPPWAGHTSYQSNPIVSHIAHDTSCGPPARNAREGQESDTHIVFAPFVIESGVFRTYTYSVTQRWFYNCRNCMPIGKRRFFPGSYKVEFEVRYDAALSGYHLSIKKHGFEKKDKIDPVHLQATCPETAPENN